MAPVAAGEQSHVLLGRDHLQRRGTHSRRDDHFDELSLDDGLCGFCVQLPVEGNDAAKGGFRVGGKGEVVGVQQRRGDGHATGVGVFDDHAGRFGEILHTLQCGVGVRHVVVGQFLALQLPGGGDAGLGRACFDVECRFLVRVFPVAHLLRLVELCVERARERR